MDDERLQQLALLDFSWSALDARFSKGLEALTRFRKKHGHCRVPARFQDEEGFFLGRWVIYQDKRLLEGKLSPHREETLRQLGLELMADTGVAN